MKILGSRVPKIACPPRFRKFGAYIRRDGLASPLRCANDMLWLIHLGAAEEVTFSRPLHPLERLTLQGFSPEMGRGMLKKADRLGNRVDHLCFFVSLERKSWCG